MSDVTPLGCEGVRGMIDRGFPARFGDLSMQPELVLGINQRFSGARQCFLVVFQYHLML